MPYILSPIIRPDQPGLWGEGTPYTTQPVMDFPPVHYDSHTIKPHSLTHVDAPAHTIPGGATVDQLFAPEKRECFYGPVLVIKLELTRNPHRITRDELKAAITKVGGHNTLPERLIIAPTHPDSNTPFVLDQDAADWLTKDGQLKTFGTSWKSTDYVPGSNDRPIHRMIFQTAVILECLDLNLVPEGEYFLSAFPLPLYGASESPVCPVLFTHQELNDELTRRDGRGL